MKRQDLFDKVTAAKMETRDALQTMYNALNQGQRKKIVKNVLTLIKNLPIIRLILKSGDQLFECNR